MTLILHFYTVYLFCALLCRRLSPRRRLDILHHHTRPFKGCCVVGARWRGYSYRRVRALPPRALSCSVQACCAAEQGRDPYSWAGSAPEHRYLPLLALLDLPSARAFAGLGCWFFPTSSFAIWSILPHWYPASRLCPALPWPGLALFKRRARIGLCQESGGLVRGGGWLVGWLLLATSAFGTGQTSFACMGDGVMGGTMRHYGCSTHQRESASASSARSAHSANSITSQWSAKGIACR